MKPYRILSVVAALGLIAAFAPAATTAIWIVCAS